MGVARRAGDNNLSPHQQSSWCFLRYHVVGLWKKKERTHSLLLFSIMHQPSPLSSFMLYQSCVIINYSTIVRSSSTSHERKKRELLHVISFLFLDSTWRTFWGEGSAISVSVILGWPWAFFFVMWAYYTWNQDKFFQDFAGRPIFFDIFQRQLPIILRWNNNKTT